MGDRAARSIGSPRHRRLLLCAALALGAAGLLLLAAATARAETVTRSFFAQEEEFVVPAGIASIQVVAVGGSGGNDGNGIKGGRGAVVHGELSVTAGEVLYVHVGGDGASGKASWERGEGGHASDVRTQPLSAGLSPDPRLIVAGAGGGAGGEGHGGALLPGGEGGNAGESGGESGEAQGGEPGTQTAGGEGGVGECSSGEDGKLGLGGEGGFCAENSGLYGGDGGDGYYGGGGGGTHGHLDIIHEGEPGGGGGSSLVPLGGTLALTSEAPQVRISYTVAEAPTAVTEPAASVTQTSATLNATVNPHGGDVTDCHFEYGTTTGYGASAPCSALPGSGSAPVAVSAAVGGLASNTTYHFRIVATNAEGTSVGADQAFTTLPSPPTVVTEAASSITQTGARLNASVNPNGENVTACYFEWDTSTKYLSRAPCSVSPGSGQSPVAVSAPIGYLTPGTTYHFRIVATNAAGTSAGTDQTFTTPSASGPLALADLQIESSLTPTSVTLEGMVKPEGVEVSECYFEFGTTSAYGSSLPCSPSPGSGTSWVPVSAQLNGLSPNTTYHYRLVAANANGVSDTFDGAVTTFPPESAPEFGRCIKAPFAGSGTFAKANCATLGGEKTYQWYPAFGGPKPLVKAHFTTALKSLTEAKLQTASGQVVACTGETGAGQYSGTRTVANVTITLTGCHLGELGTCQSSGAAAGEVAAATLDGELGVIKTSTEGPTKNTIGLDLRPASGETVASFACGATPVLVTGSVIAAVSRDAMALTPTVKFTAAKGIQKPTRFEGGEEDVLLAKLGAGAFEHVGLSMTLVQKNEEKVEINTVV